MLLASLCLEGADLKGVFPPGAKLIGPYSPGIVAGDYLYVSGQGAKRTDGSFPTDAGEQIEECLTKIKTIATAAGFSMEGIAYSQIYVRDTAAFTRVEEAWAKHFPKNGPARSVIGVTSLPDDTPVEVNAVLIHDAGAKKSLVVSPRNGPVSDLVLTPDRAYVSDCRGVGGNDAAADVEAALARMGAVLKAGGLVFNNMVFVNPFMTDQVGYEQMNRGYAKRFEFGNTPARATINVAALPDNARIEFTGVAVRDLGKRRAVRPKNMPPSPTASPCVFAGDTFYCSAKSGFIPGPHGGIYAETVEGQLRADDAQFAGRSGRGRARLRECCGE